QPIGAARRQPVDLRQRFGRELDAVVDDAEAVRIVAAAAGLAVEQAAADIGEVEPAGVFFLELVEAAAGAAVAQAFPLCIAHLSGRLGFSEPFRHLRTPRLSPAVSYTRARCEISTTRARRARLSTSASAAARFVESRLASHSSSR